MEVEGGDVAGVAVFVGGECVHAVGGAVFDVFGRLESDARNCGRIGSVNEPGLAIGLYGWWSVELALCGGVKVFWGSGCRLYLSATEAVYCRKRYDCAH